ncbi:hypothetical protein AAZX31_14G109900 [Glycine max]|uniref:Histone-lysine N-methyltransferase TRX1 n=1 Tax=Glycine soja TaxID=3848 RepID=A0A445H4K7_GLYSO|nr:uncharacterized protein LOC114385058 isoform X1 [Glycine soja]XP_028200806.1 uncharacterized protein LOC114385058 isoform X1 [Glycine soja]KAH1094100.1 hypothetical protein GYH30_039706 [Glycine max]RZB68590.1 Histone-lysine N-methyltransferase TRX1 [Glycine soja]
MESPWERKCDSPLQPSTSATVLSAPPPETKEINTSYCLYPQVAHGLRSKFVGGKQGHVYQSFPHSTAHGSGQADTRNSFLSLLYGPPSLLQHEFRDLSDRKLCFSSGDCTAAIGNSVVGSIESGTFQTSGVGLMTENLINHNLQSRVTTFPEISSRAMVGLNNSNNFVFHDIQSSNTAIQPPIPGSEKARESFSSPGQCQGTIPASSLNVCCSDIQTTQTIALEPSSSKYATPFMSGCPRVFCMGKSGHLLLSNTGLLGIVCSCHCCHMSVLKFCEHSGLHGIDPGEAVRMESGETISQWQKLYFLKFGIRSLGNENEWDWPDVLSTRGSLMRSNSSAFDMSKTNLSHMLSSSAVMSRKQATTIQDGCNIPLKGFTCISQNSLYDQLKNQLMVSNLAMYTTAPNFIGTQLDDGCQPIPPSFDSLKRKRNLSSAHSPLQTSTSLLKDHDCIKKKNASDGLVGRDAASSNIDLRLGQPPQTGNPLPSFVEPPLFNALASPPKSQPLKQMITNADLSREEELQNNFSYAAGSIKMVEEMPQLKLKKYMSAVVNASARARSETKNVAKGLSFSPFLQFDNQYGGKTKTSENLWNDGSPIMPKKLYSDYGHTGRQSTNSGIRTNKCLNNDKGVNFAKDSGVKINSGFGIGQLMKYPSSIKRAVGGSDISVVNGKIHELNHESSLPSDTSVCADILRGSNNVSFLGQENHTPETSISFKGILKGLSHHVSSSVSNQTPTLPQQQQGINMDSCLLDENLRLLALTQILELSKQQHALYFNNMNQKQGGSNSISKVQHYMYEASTSEQGTSGATLKLLQNRGIYGNHESTVGLEKLASLTGMNSYCHLSGLSPRPLHSKEKESQCNHSYDLQNEETSLSLGINKDNTRSSVFEKCSEQPSNICFGGKYTCAAQINCCKSNFFSGIEPLCYIIKQKLANASGETSLKMASDLSRDMNSFKGENIEQGGKLDGQDSIKIGFRTPQWRDVPSKVRKAVCDATSLGQTATGMDWEGQDSVQLGNISMKRFKRTIDMGDMSKEQENSNVSSGCSAPVVTQASLEVNKIEPCMGDAVDTGFVNNLVVDEGSGIDKGWSSDLVEKSDEFLGSSSGSCLKNDYLRVLNDQPCCNLLDDLKLLDSLIWKKGWNQNNFVLSSNCKSNQSQKVKKGLKGKKRKRNLVRILDASLSSEFPSLLHKKNEEVTGICNSSSSCSKEMQMRPLSSLQKSSNKSSFVQPSNKQKHTAFSSKFLSCKNHLNKHQSYKVGYESESSSDAEFRTLPGVSGSKKLKKDLTSDCFEQFQMQEPAYEEPENDKLRPFSCRKENAHRITRPVVCGKYGEISSGHLAREVQKPVKIVSLRKVLKSSKRCRGHTNGKPIPTSKKKWKRLSIGTSSGHCCGNPGLKIKEHNETQNAIFFNKTNVDLSMEDLDRGGKPPVVYKGKRDAKAKQGNSVGNRAYVSLKVKNKEIRKQRSITELTAKETKVMDMMNSAQDQEPGLCSTASRNSIQGHMNIATINSDAFCCVCRSSSNDKINYLLECSRCLIRVHQACYGVSSLPKKSSWCCRPCRTNSKNIVCVLCGYGGGAMTRAIMSHTIVKSLLKVWNGEKDGMPKNTTSHEVFEKEIDAFLSSKDGQEVDQESVLKPKIVDTSTDLMKVTNHIQHTPTSVSNFKVHNSITEAVLDPTVKQWIHMVCGLWTPGTRCPNVDTMSAFDVSGVSRPRADVVCYICNRWGGSCIECRIADCSIKFHPWCAHQKNLLQSETEGIDDEKIGFYGRCTLHIIEPRCLPIYDPLDEIGSQEEKEFTCARAEGYKGRRWDGFQNNQCQGGCLVPEEQLNAWIHINGQKLCSRGLPKFPDLDIEHDCRKEYARYKQAKGWKHLVVYKSRIHALGLYTSRFISRGEMVVEYIGEIVGLRVADKREKEYQSGRKLQYKTACYFFRIDKEHIIDATRKGGIARFVNHSCLPNCVAKVITVRHEKKVVFLAERDIFPGEEITYDYHFNHEDEGKIPCYCNSKNCRRYMN